MCTGLSEIYNHNEQLTPLLGAYMIRIPSYRHNDIPIAVMDG